MIVFNLLSKQQLKESIFKPRQTPVAQDQSITFLHIELKVEKRNGLRIDHNEVDNRISLLVGRCLMKDVVISFYTNHGMMNESILVNKVLQLLESRTSSSKTYMGVELPAVKDTGMYAWYRSHAEDFEALSEYDKLYFFYKYQNQKTNGFIGKIFDGSS